MSVFCALILMFGGGEFILGLGGGGDVMSGLFVVCMFVSVFFVYIFCVS